MAEAHGPAGPRRRLGAELRRLRNAAGLHLDDVARRLDCSTSKISRLENGKGIPKLPDVRELLRIYGVTADDVRDDLLALVRDGRRQGWWEPFTEGVQTERFVLDAPGRYAALETEAVNYRGFTGLVLPGLLQTEAYATVLLTTLLPDHSAHDVASLVQLRMSRQQALRRTVEPLRVTAVMDEAFLCRVVGGPELMAEQLASIVERAAMSNVEIRVLPFSAGIHRAHVGQFTILELREPLGDTVYIESHSGDSYLDSEEDTKLYRDVFDDVAGKSMSPRASVALVAEYCRAYQTGFQGRGGP